MLSMGLERAPAAPGAPVYGLQSPIEPCVCVNIYVHTHKKETHSRSAEYFALRSKKYIRSTEKQTRPINSAVRTPLACILKLLYAYAKILKPSTDQERQRARLSAPGCEVEVHVSCKHT